MDELRYGRIGRFPVWVVGLVLAGIIIVFVWWRGRTKGVGASVDEPVLDSVDGIPTMSFADEISGRFPSTVQLAAPPERPETNAQWLIAAFDYLVGLAKNPATVQRALTNYLQGKVLTAEEQELVNTATSNTALSLPPEGVVLPPITPAPSTPGNTPPPSSGSRRYVIVKKYTTHNPPWESTLSGIASRYGRTVQQLAEWNGISDPDRIFPYQKIWVDPPS